MWIDVRLFGNRKNKQIDIDENSKHTQPQKKQTRSKVIPFYGHVLVMAQMTLKELVILLDNNEL